MLDILQQGGVIDAELIQVSREKGISNIDFNLDDFPQIQDVDEVKLNSQNYQEKIRTSKKILNWNMIISLGIVMQ